MPAVVLVLLAIASAQTGSAFAKGLFDDVGPGGAVFLRLLFAALALLAVSRPSARGRTRRDLGLVTLFGLVLACMNLAFYSALNRIPLSAAVTLEFIGPLGVAVAGSRRPLDLVWVGLAAGGIVLLADLGGGGLDGLGVALALLAGAFWAAYILVTARVGRRFDGAQGLALAMVVGAIAMLPVGVADAGGGLLSVPVLAAAAGVALLSSAIPYGLEMEALRTVPTGVFGVLLSLEPGVAALTGFLVLGEGLRPRELVAIGLVIAASAGASGGGQAHDGVVDAVGDLDHPRDP